MSGFIIIGINILFRPINVSKRKITLISTMLILMFMILANFVLSVIRVCIMTSLMLMANMVYRKSDVWTNIALSLLIILIANPYNIKSSGVLLSYGGTIRNNIFYKII